MLLLSVLLVAVAGCRRDEESPRLVILIVLDGFRADYIDRFLDVLDDGGLRELTSNGTVFSNARVDYFFSATGPGHAAIGTGCYPAQNGIIANYWWDADRNKKIECVHAGKSRLLKSAEGETDGASPSYLRGPQFAEVFKQASGPGTRVFSVSAKARSAVLLGGRAADGVFWFEDGVGGFTSSSFYEDSIPPWVERFNVEHDLTRYCNEYWNLLLPPEGRRLCGPDSCRFEVDDFSLGIVFPHPLACSPDADPSSFHHMLRHTPVLDELTGDFILRLINEEGLGTDDTPDLLLVSFSSIDEIGHDFGPTSLEVGDAIWRVDRQIARLLDALSRFLVVREDCLLIVTSDHGMTPLPELSSASGRDAGRVVTGPVEGQKDLVDVETLIEKALGEVYGENDWVLSVPYPSVHLNMSLFKRKGLPGEDGIELAREALRGLTGVREVVTAGEIAIGHDPGSLVWPALERWYFPKRCGELIMLIEPDYVFSSAVYAMKGGTNHGSFYDEDCHIPLLFYGKNIRRAVREDTASHVDIAPSILSVLGFDDSGIFDGKPLL